jgi:hypothetical protein
MIAVVLWLALRPRGTTNQPEEDTALEARFIDYLRK